MAEAYSALMPCTFRARPRIGELRASRCDPSISDSHAQSNTHLSVQPSQRSISVKQSTLGLHGCDLAQLKAPGCLGVSGIVLIPSCSFDQFLADAFAMPFAMY